MDMFLPPRSQYILKDEARYEWEHEILRGVCWNGETVKATRQVSLIFRDELQQNIMVD